MEARTGTSQTTTENHSKTVITINTTKSIYFEALLKAYEPQDEFFSMPNATTVLHKLLQRYIDLESEANYFFFSHSLSHVAFAKKCIATLKTSKPDDIIQVIKEINEIKEMTIRGDFSRMLVTFFNAFPEYLKYCEHSFIHDSAGQDFWDKSSREWLNHFKDAHREGKESINHEQLEHIAAVVPKDMACDYADFLLNELNVNNKPEANRPGLYKGWVCVALGTLADNLPPWKKQEISNELFGKHLTRTNTNYSVIGLCLALARLSSNKDTLASTADHLRRYVANQLPNLKGEFGPTVSTVSLYMPKVFNALHQLEMHLADSVTRKSIVQLLLKPDNMYPFRQGITELHGWVMQPDLENELHSLFSTLLHHDKFAALVTQFWSWLRHAKGASVLNDQYFKSLEVAAAQLKAPNNHTTIRESLALLHTYDEQLNPKEKDQLAKCVARMLDPQNKIGLSAKKRAEVHTVMSDLKPWFSDASRPVAMNMIKQSMYNHTENDRQVRISGAKALFAFRQECEAVTAADIKCFRDESLHDLTHDADNEAALALKEYAISVKAEKLPDLMMCLSAIPDANAPAKLLLAEVRNIYLDKLITEKKLLSEVGDKETLKVALK